MNIHRGDKEKDNDDGKIIIKTISWMQSVNDLEEKHIPRGINTFCFFVIGDFYNSFYIRTKERSP